MMAGLSLAGLGGFAQGLASGLKTSSDLADAEERRGLTGLQKKVAEIDLKEREDKRAYEEEKRQTIDSILNPKQSVETTPPPADQDSLPEYERGQAGIAVPKPKTGMFDQSGSVNDIGTLNKLNNAMVMLDAKHNKLSVADLLNNAKRYKELQNEGVMDAWQRVASGDYQGAIDTFNSTGKFRLPEGTKFEARQEDDGFGAGHKITNYYAIAPDGRTVNYRDMMRSTISPDKLAEIDSATGYRIADLALKRTAEENAATRHTELFKLTEMKYDRLIAEQKSQTGIALERLNIAKDDHRYNKTQQAFTGSFAELTNALGVDKKFDYNLADKDQRTAQADKLLAASGAQSIFEMNYDLGKNSANLTPQQALNAWKLAASNPSLVKVDEETGLGYIEQGKKRINVPTSMAPKSDASQSDATPRGISLPSGPSVNGRPLYNANQNDLVRIASRPKGISVSEARTAQDELDARQREGGRMSPGR